MARTLMSDLSVSELRHMREEEKLSNLEIAQRLGVSYQTIYKILGPQPKGLRKPRTYLGNVVNGIVHRPSTRDDPDQSKEAALISIERPLSMAGMVGEYMIHPATSTIDIKINDQEIYGVKYDALDTLITELTRIRSNCKKVDRGDLVTW